MTLLSRSREQSEPPSDNPFYGACVYIYVYISRLQTTMTMTYSVAISKKDSSEVMSGQKAMQWAMPQGPS